MSKYTFEEIYEFLEQCKHDNYSFNDGYDDYDGNCTECPTWSRESFDYELDGMNYEVAFVEDFIDKKNNFVEVCVYDNEAYQRIFQITKYENGYTTLADNCNNLRAIDNYRLMKTLNSDLKTKVPSAKREKI